MISLRPYKLLFSICFFSTVSATELAKNNDSQYEEDYYETSLIKELRNFREEAVLAHKENKILLVEFSTPWCEYCETLEQQVLEPLIRSKRYQNTVIIRKLEINDHSSVTGFDNKRYETEEISMHYKINLYPTLIFFDYKGNEIGNRFVGIRTLDYIGEQLDKAIDKAIGPVKQ